MMGIPDSVRALIPRESVTEEGIDLAERALARAADRDGYVLVNRQSGFDGSDLFIMYDTREPIDDLAIVFNSRLPA